MSSLGIKLYYKYACIGKNIKHVQVWNIFSLDEGEMAHLLKPTLSVLLN